MVTILVHFGTFGAFWWTSCATPWPLHDLLWLLNPLKCPFIPEMDHISHSGQIRNALLSHGTVTILVHSSAFWSFLVHFVGDPTTPLYWIFIKSSKTCILHTKNFLMRPILPSYLGKYWSNMGPFHGLKWKKATTTYHVDGRGGSGGTNFPMP